MRSALLSIVVFAVGVSGLRADESLPNIVLVMADDMGWGQTGYYQHPVLATPHLDAMARNGLRFDRFYSGASNCSPTRATVMTGRSNDRTGVFNHGFPLRLQEKTVARSLREAGYVTGHFGKWHLNGLRGPGVPILASDTHSPGGFGFDAWLSTTNFFDLNPILSRRGQFEEFAGDSSEIIVGEALKFMRATESTDEPFFAVIWFGTPHSPWRALPKDQQPFEKLEEASRQHYGEMVALDRSLGTLRQGLRDLEVAENTIVWFCSDNGGLPGITPDTVGGLRGYKNTLYEGGLRVPAIVEWPAVIAPRVTEYPAVTMDIFPTLSAIANLPKEVLLQPQDGISLLPLFREDIKSRETPLPFRHDGRGAWIDNNYKLLTQEIGGGKYELFDLQADPNETKDLASELPDVLARMREAFELWNTSVESSVAGRDYPEGHVLQPQPERRFWSDEQAYEEYFDAWKTRPEYESRLK